MKTRHAALIGTLSLLCIVGLSESGVTEVKLKMGSSLAWDCDGSNIQITLEDPISGEKCNTRKEPSVHSGQVYYFNHHILRQKCSNLDIEQPDVRVNIKTIDEDKFCIESIDVTSDSGFVYTAVGDGFDSAAWFGTNTNDQMFELRFHSAPSGWVELPVGPRSHRDTSQHFIEKIDLQTSNYAMEQTQIFIHDSHSRCRTSTVPYIARDEIVHFTGGHGKLDSCTNFPFNPNTARVLVNADGDRFNRDMVSALDIVTHDRRYTSRSDGSFSEWTTPSPIDLPPSVCPTQGCPASEMVILRHVPENDGLVCMIRCPFVTSVERTTSAVNTGFLCLATPQTRISNVEYCCRTGEITDDEGRVTIQSCPLPSY